MSASLGSPDEQKASASKTTQETADPYYQKIITMTVIEILAFAVGVSAAINFFFYSMPRGDQANMIIASALTIIFATIGTAAHLLARLPDKPIAKERVDESLRPFMGVSRVEKQMAIGQPVSISITFTNRGKSPAIDVEVRGKLQFLPTDAPLDRTYDGSDFDRASRQNVNINEGVKAQFISRDGRRADVLELENLMQMTTDLSHTIVAHGVVRYRSKYIDGGADELPFCYEFDGLSGEMVACRQRTESGKGQRPK